MRPSPFFFQVKGIDGGMDVYLLKGRRNGADPSRGLGSKEEDEEEES